MRRRLWILTGLVCLPLIAQAQHIFETGLRVGMADWYAKTNYVKVLPDGHAGVELAYAYHSPKVVGVRIGVTADLHRAAFGKRNYEDMYETTDVEEQTMQVESYLDNLRETYSFWSVGIPVQLSLSWENLSFSVGPKVVFPIANSWKEKVYEYSALYVYYPDQDNRVYESYPLAATRNFSMQKEGELKLPIVQWWLSSELTYSFPVGSSRRIQSFVTIGAYFDWSFSNTPISHSEAKSLVMLTDIRDGFPLERVLTPVLEGNRQGEALVNKCSLFDVGIKIAYAISPYNPNSNHSSHCHCLPYQN